MSGAGGDFGSATVGRRSKVLSVWLFVVLLLSGLCTGYVLNGVARVVDSFVRYRDNVSVSMAWSDR